MGAGLAGADRDRIGRDGFGALDVTEGLALFDAALADGGELLVPVRLDLGVVRRPRASRRCCVAWSGCGPAGLPPAARKRPGWSRAWPRCPRPTANRR